MDQNPPQFTRPYVFILKEGKKINQDFLDYSLLLVNTQGAKPLHSPITQEKPATDHRLLFFGRLQEKLGKGQGDA